MSSHTTGTGVILPGTLVNTPLVAGQGFQSSCDTTLDSSSVVNWSELVTEAGDETCGNTLVVRTPESGVSAIKVGEQSLSGVVELQGGVSVSEGKITVSSSSSSTSTKLIDLLDVAISVDGNGDPIITDGAVLRWTDYETGGVWIASDTLDGGSY